MSWQHQQPQRLPRIMTNGDEGERDNDRRQMGPPSHSLPSLNFRQLAPLRSPNLPSSTHSSSYFAHQRNRSTSESTGEGGFRPLRPTLPEPQSLILSSAKRGEALPPLAAFGRPSPPRGSPSMNQDYVGRSSKPIQSTHPSHYHPYQQHSPHPPSHYQSSTPSRSMQSPPFGSGPYYPGLQADRSNRPLFSPTPSSQTHEMSLHGSRESSTIDGDESSPRKLAKSHVPSACLNCKRAHLACDVSRPCRRCINLGKTDTCIDVQHKKRGRPRLRDREAAAVAAAAAAAATVSNPKAEPGGGEGIPSGLPSQRLRGSISSSSSTSTMRKSPRSEPNAFLSPRGDISMPFSPSKTPSSSTSIHSRGRSVSSSASLWSQQVRSGMTAPFSEYHNEGGNSNSNGNNGSMPTVSLILSTGLQCARCSVESHALLGFAPSDLVERSLFELVHPTEIARLEQLWLSLIEPVGVRPQVVPTNAETIMNLSPALLMAPAPGTVFMQETMRLRQRSGIFDFYSIRLHLGGGLGADLYQPESLDRTYIVASLLKLGNDATHPDPSVLREARWYLGGDPRHFTTPQMTKRSGEDQSNGGSSHNSTHGRRYEMQGEEGGMNNNNNTMGPIKPALRSSPPPSHHHLQRHPPAPFQAPPPPSSYSHRTDHASSHRRVSQSRLAHDMDVASPPMAKQLSQQHHLIPSHADHAMAAVHPSQGASRPSLSKGSSASSPFSYSSRTERGGITC